MRDTCTSIIKVHRFLGARIFYRSWLPNYSHVADVLYQLLRKGKKFIWKDDHSKAIQMLNSILFKASTLRKVDYKLGRPIILTVDTRSIGIGWSVLCDIRATKFILMLKPTLLEKASSEPGTSCK